MHISSEYIPHNAPPFFSILILCWNSRTYIHDCLQSIQNQIFKDFEVLLIDNGSQDPISSEELVDFPDLGVRYYSLKQNIGYAAGNNYAAKLAKGRYLVLLNSDAFAQPDWLAVIREAITSHPNCTFASKLVMAKSPQLLDGEGDNYHASGLVWRNSYGRPVAKSATSAREVFSACGAAAVYPKQAFDTVGGFDADYFAYAEDVDLGFRLRLAGVPCMYLPSAVVHHVGYGSTGQGSDLSVYYGQRNLVWTYFKDMPGFLFAFLLPGHLLMNLGMILYSCFRKQGRVTFRAKRDAFASLGMILKKRREIQKLRKTPAISLMKIIDWNPFSPLQKLLKK